MATTIKVPEAFARQILNEKPASSLPPPAVFFQEGSGFFFLKYLGGGANGTAILARSLRNSKLYVLKEDIDTEDEFSADRHMEVSSAELVSHLPGVAKVCGWAKHAAKPMEQSFGVSCWEYYNAGTLDDLYEASRLYEEYIPERWMCMFTISMLKTITDIHQRGLAHGDCNTRNWFLHRPSPNNDPVVVLGDFGMSYTKSHAKSFGRASFEMKPFFDAHDKPWEETAVNDFDTTATVLRWLFSRAKPKDFVQVLADKLKVYKNDLLTLNLQAAGARTKEIISQAEKCLQFARVPTDWQDKLIRDQTPSKLYDPYTDGHKKTLQELKTWRIANFTSRNTFTTSEPPPDRTSRQINAGDWQV